MILWRLGADTNNAVKWRYSVIGWVANSAAVIPDDTRASMRHPIDGELVEHLTVTTPHRNVDLGRRHFRVRNLFPDALVGFGTGQYEQGARLQYPADEVASIH